MAGGGAAVSGPEVWDEATARWYVERYGEHATYFVTNDDIRSYGEHVAD